MGNNFVQKGQGREIPFSDNTEFPKAEGMKFDADKPRFSLLPLPAIHETIKVLELGARKYAENNWQKVDNHRDRYYNAVQRHILAWYEGEANDPETGLNHLAHASCNVLFLLWFDLQEKKRNAD